MSKTPLVVAFLSLAAVAAAAPRERVVADLGTKNSLAPPATFTIVLRCEACSPVDAPDVVLQWRHGAADGSDLRRVVHAIDWASGQFEIVDGEDATPLAATPAQDGWAVEIPTGKGLGLPTRAHGMLPGFAAQRAVHVPRAQAIPRADFVFEPVSDVLLANPAWDPEQTTECDVVVSKSSVGPATFVSGGEPRAWLFPAVDPDAAAAGEWTFQFVRPGRSLLERISVNVIPADDGDSWSFRLPLRGVLPVADRELPGDAANGGLRVVDVTPIGLEVHSGQHLGILDLGDCPRLAR